MARKLAMIVLVALSVLAFGAEKDEGISNPTPNGRIPSKKYASIRDLDFRNAPVLKLDLNDKRSFWPSLKNGTFYRKDRVMGGDPHSGDEITLESVRYLRTKGQRDYAL